MAEYPNSLIRRQPTSKQLRIIRKTEQETGVSLVKDSQKRVFTHKITLPHTAAVSEYMSFGIVHVR
jgi:hypothetical protein